MEPASQLETVARYNNDWLLDSCFARALRFVFAANISSSARALPYGAHTQAMARAESGDVGAAPREEGGGGGNRQAFARLS